MKKLYRNLFALIPLCALAAGCSDSDPKNELTSAEGDFHVMMSVLPTGSTSAETGTTSAGTDAERAYDPDHIYFAIYKSDFSYDKFIKDGSQKNNGVNGIDANYFEPTWGPSVAFRLKKEDYKNGFVVGFYSVPSNCFNGTFTTIGKSLPNNNDDFELKWPGTTTDGATAWSPNKDNGNHIPMGGLVQVSQEYMTKYNPNVYTGVSPMALPNVKPMRAMAKVVIEDPEGLIAKAEMKTAKFGVLISSPTEMVGNIGSIQPRMSTKDRTTFTQKLEKSEATVKDGVATYTFYSYEQSFRGTTSPTGSDLAVDAEGRKIVTLTSDPTKLKGADGNAVTLKVAIAPYDGGVPAFDGTTGELMAADNGSWQGLMRNRIYTYRITSPNKVSLHISVRVEDWEKKVQHETL